MRLTENETSRFVICDLVGEEHGTCHPKSGHFNLDSISMFTNRTRVYFVFSLMGVRSISWLGSCLALI